MISVDIGATNLRIASVSNSYEVLDKVVHDTPKDPAEIINLISQSLAKFGKESNIGVSVAGVVDDKQGIFVALSNLDIFLYDFRKAFIKETGMTCSLIHDAHASALGEMQAGQAKNAKDFIYITLSTGIGGAIIKDGKPIFGAKGYAGEVGHMTLLPEGPRCGCGKNGCWEALASGSGLERLGINPIQVFEEARSGDEAAKEIVNHVAFYHGIGVANLVNAFDPELVVLGGGQIKSFDIMKDEFDESLTNNLYPNRNIGELVKLSTLGDDNALIGAAFYARRQS